MSYDSYNKTGTLKKRIIAHPRVFRGTASAPFVPAQGLRAHGNNSLPTPGLRQPRSSRLTESRECKVTGRLWHWGFCHYVWTVWPLWQPPALTLNCFPSGPTAKVMSESMPVLRRNPMALEEVERLSCQAFLGCCGCWANFTFLPPDIL